MPWPPAAASWATSRWRGRTRAQWIAPWLDSVWQDAAACAADVPPCAGVHRRVRARDGARRGRDDGGVRARRRPRAQRPSGEPAGSSRILRACRSPIRSHRGKARGAGVLESLGLERRGRACGVDAAAEPSEGADGIRRFYDTSASRRWSAAPSRTPTTGSVGPKDGVAVISYPRGSGATAEILGRGTDRPCRSGHLHHRRRHAGGTSSVRRPALRRRSRFRSPATPGRRRCSRRTRAGST